MGTDTVCVGCCGCEPNKAELEFASTTSSHTATNPVAILPWQDILIVINDGSDDNDDDDDNDDVPLQETQTLSPIMTNLHHHWVQRHVPYSNNKLDDNKDGDKFETTMGWWLRYHHVLIMGWQIYHITDNTGFVVDIRRGSCTAFVSCCCAKAKWIWWMNTWWQMVTSDGFWQNWWLVDIAIENSGATMDGHGVPMTIVWVLSYLSDTNGINSVCCILELALKGIANCQSMYG